MSSVSRRNALKLVAAGTAASALGCQERQKPQAGREAPATASQDAVLRTTPLGFPWQTPDPFLACMHHRDAYPAGNEAMGPVASLSGRNLGRDFENVDGWNMYHGRVVPGFPQHPHRGFETVTVVRTGLLDHSDSLGAAARYGNGDVQWLTAGQGILHAEMFPLLRSDRDNPLELFQIWLNLPKRDKMVPPHFSMLWNEKIPKPAILDDAGRTTRVAVIAGPYGAHVPADPAPNSWAASVENDVAIWTIQIDPHAAWVLPAGRAGSNRSLYYHRGEGLTIAQRAIPVDQRIELRADAEVLIQNGSSPSELVLLQGQPIGEPVVKSGPFVMNTQEEIQTAYADYRRTQFGGWPWADSDQVHPREQERFARRADGEIDKPV